MNRRIVELAAKIAERKAGECKGCDGKVYTCGFEHDGCCSAPVDMGDCACPTCARLREIAKWEWRDRESVKRKNPTFTVQTLRQLLEDLGEWRNFITWLASTTWKTDNGSIDEMFNILTSDPDCQEATVSYLEGLCQN